MQSIDHSLAQEGNSSGVAGDGVSDVVSPDLQSVGRTWEGGRRHTFIYVALQSYLFSLIERATALVVRGGRLRLIRVFGYLASDSDKIVLSKAPEASGRG